MSSNSNHINSIINRENYEEYFLLLVDNELTKEEELAVEAFLEAHPDLQPELDLLRSLKLPAEETSFLNKELLFAEGMRINQLDESLLLYIDNELNKEDKEWLEGKIAQDAQLHARHQQLLSTKLDASDHVSYPFKKELYRHEEPRKIPLYWMRVAAAVLMAVGVGGFIYFNQQPGSTEVVISAPGPGKLTPPVELPTPVRELAQREEKETKKTNPVTKKVEANKATESLARYTAPKTLVKKKVQAEYKGDDTIEEFVKEKALDNGLASTPQQRIPQQTPPQQSINNAPVTNGSVASYNDEEAPLSPAVIRDALVRTDNDKKSSLKGLLRKATRFIERRTNISATNENDELLIGAVALKL